MIALDLTRWKRVQHADGSVELTARPTHPAFAAHRHATLRIRHGVQPITTLDAACSELRGPRRIEIVRAGPSERIVTRDGQYGAFRSLEVTVGGDALSWAVGVIAGDDRMTVIDGLARSPTICALVRDAIDDCASADAFDRIRMIPYRPPAGWFGVRRSLATCWLAPCAPTVIVVGDAVPRGPAEHLHALLWPFAAPERATRGAIDGTAIPAEVATWTVDGRIWSVFELTSARWKVRVALEAGEDQHVIVLRDLVRSIELPTPPTTHIPQGLDLATWMAM